MILYDSIKIVLLAGSFFVVLSFSLGAEERSNQKEVTSSFNQVEQKVDLQDATGLGTKICPVFYRHQAARAEFYSDYNGKRYHFCCPECINYFENNPEFFITRMKKTISQYLKNQVEDKDTVKSDGRTSSKEFQEIKSKSEKSSQER